MAEEKHWKENLHRILDYIDKLDDKYDNMGQDMFAYLEGLLHSNGSTYWEYIHLDSLLGLQTPKTNIPDEVIFITYHQITELYFKLIKHEINQLVLTPEGDAQAEYLDAKMWVRRLSRCNNYLKHLTSSFDIMITGMDRKQFKQFRMALLPASGFQSVAFREIEIMSTSLKNLLHIDRRDHQGSTDKVYNSIYWKGGGISSDTGKKTLTLKQFEQKYDRSLIDMLYIYQEQSILSRFEAASVDVKLNENVVEQMKAFDRWVNVFWRMSHLAAASTHLIMRDKEAIEATGGTNWERYLPPKFQKLHFFPKLWTEQERNDWGKTAVQQLFNTIIGRDWMQSV